MPPSDFPFDPASPVDHPVRVREPVEPAGQSGRRAVTGRDFVENNYVYLEQCVTPVAGSRRLSLPR